MDKKNGTSRLLTTNRFVAFLDIMGFKDMVLRREHNDIYKMLSDISKLQKVINKFDKELYIP